MKCFEVTSLVLREEGGFPEGVIYELSPQKDEGIYRGSSGNISHSTLMTRRAAEDSCTNLRMNLRQRRTRELSGKVISNSHIKDGTHRFHQRKCNGRVNKRDEGEAITGAQKLFVQRMRKGSNVSS